MAARDWLFALAAVGVVLVLALYGFPAYRIAAPDRGGAVLTPDIGKRESPTVSPLREDGWVAVRVMVLADEANEVMDKLADLGARAILVTAIHAARL